MRRFKAFRYVLLTLIFTMTLAACDSIGSGIESSPSTPTAEEPETTTPPATEAPPDTEAPPATEAPVEGEEEGLPSEALWIGLGILLLFLLIGWGMGRSRKSAAAPVAAVPVVAWKDHAQEGYSEARWLYDGLNEDLAVWRGNALFDGASDAGEAAGTSLAQTWAQLGGRTDKATDSLYRAEAAAPDQTTAETIRNVVAALQVTRSAVDARAEARFNTRGVDASDQSNAAQAAERERLASGTLAEARTQLSAALTALSAIG